MNLDSNYYWNTGGAHRELMTKYYRLQAPIYDLTRWMFLFGRTQILRDLQLKSGEVVIEVGCGTGRNFSMIRKAVGEHGELIAVDCSGAMLERARDRVRAAGWKNVRVIDQEYGFNTVTRGEADVVLFSYSLSMIPSWQTALHSARQELHRKGRIGIVDFCPVREKGRPSLFAQWMSWNHVDIDRNYRLILERHFQTDIWAPKAVFGNRWGYIRYLGHCRPL